MSSSSLACALCGRTLPYVSPCRRDSGPPDPVSPETNQSSCPGCSGPDMWHALRLHDQRHRIFRTLRRFRERHHPGLPLRVRRFLDAEMRRAFPRGCRCPASRDDFRWDERQVLDWLRIQAVVQDRQTLYSYLTLRMERGAETAEGPATANEASDDAAAEE